MSTRASDYSTWRWMAWTGPIFFTTFFVMWGLLAKNFPPMGADLTPAQIYAHYQANGLAIAVGMSVCMTFGACYMTWGAAVSRIMRRIEGPEGMLASVEMMGATITYCPIVIACGIWLTAALEVANLSPELVHVMYRLGWMIIDLAYLVTSFQIIAASLVFLRDKREKKLVPSWVSWWGFVTVASFFPVSLVPFFLTGPFAFHGLFNFWIAFPTWYIWIVSMSIFVIKAINRLEVEDGLAAKQDARGPALATATR